MEQYPGGIDDAAAPTGQHRGDVRSGQVCRVGIATAGQLGTGTVDGVAGNVREERPGQPGVEEGRSEGID